VHRRTKVSRPGTLERSQDAAVSMIRADAVPPGPTVGPFKRARLRVWNNPPGFVSSTSERMIWKTISMSGDRLTTGEGAWEAA
jgi:hypothetical protein